MPDDGAQEAQNREAIAQALEETGFGAEEEQAAFDESWNKFESEAENTQDAAKVESTEGSQEQAEAEEAQPDAPEEYWGIRLEGLSPEKRQEVISGLEQRDSTIHKLQQQIADLRQKSEEAPPAQEATEAPEDVDDDTLVQAIGLDPEYLDPAQKAGLANILRNQLRLEDTVESLSRERAVEKTETTWNQTLDELDSTYGKLPFGREDVLRYALAEGIGSPFEAYFRLAAPARREVEGAVAAARRDAAKRVESGGTKPRNVGAEPPPVKSGMSMREAVAASMKAAQKETGLSWRGAVKGRLTKTER